MKILTVGLSAMLAAACPAVNAATLSISTEANTGGGGFVYTAAIIRNDTIQIDQFGFALNSPDVAGSISQIQTPFGWMSSIESATSNGWAYQANGDPNTGLYGGSVGSFESPAAVLAFRFDTAGQIEARGALGTANSRLTDQKKVLTAARLQTAIASAEVPLAQEALSAATTALSVANLDLSDLKVEGQRIAQLQVSKELAAKTKFDRAQSRYVANPNDETLLALNTAAVDRNNLIALFNDVVLPAYQLAVQAADDRVIRSIAEVDTQTIARDQAQAAFSDAQAIESVAEGSLEKARLVQSSAQATATQFALASLSYLSDPVAHLFAEAESRRATSNLVLATQAVVKAAEDIVALETKATDVQAALNASNLALPDAIVAFEDAQKQFDLAAQAYVTATAVARNMIKIAQDAVDESPSLANGSRLDQANKRLIDLTNEFNFETKPRLTEKLDDKRNQVDALVGGIKELEIAQAKILADLAATRIAERDAKDAMADAQTKITATAEQLAVFPDESGRTVLGFSFFSTFGPIAGPARITGSTSDEYISVLAAGQPVPAVPLPASMLLMLAGFAGLGALRSQQSKA